MIDKINIESPIFLSLVVMIPVLWYLANTYKKYRLDGLKAFGGTNQLEGKGGIVPKKYWLSLLGILLLAIAATNPRVKDKPITTTQKGGDIIFALDVSKSMLAEDVKPSRLERAKLLCFNLLQEFDNQRVAVVVFAGDAYVTMPFSTNYSAVSNFIDEANPGQVSAQGSDYVHLIETVTEFFGKDKLVERGVVVLSDGEDHSPLRSKDVENAAKEGIVFLTVGIGKPNGAPIPDGRDYLQDRKGQKVITKLHTKSLKKLAGNKGAFFTLSEQSALLRKIRQLRESNFTDLKSYSYYSLFQWFLLPGMLLLIWPFWKQLTPKKTDILAKMSVVVLIICLSAMKGVAQDAHDRLLKGDGHYKKEQYTEAAQEYGEVVKEQSDNTQALYNLGVAEAKNNKKKEALDYFAKAAESADNQQDKASALYNSGTLLLSEKDKLDESIKTLKEALRISPKDLDIRKNLAKAMQLKRKQQEQQQQQQDQQYQDQKNQNQQEQNQQDQNQQQQDQQNQDQQNKDQQNQDQKDQDQKQDQKDQDQQNHDEQQDQNQQQRDQQPEDQQKNQQKPMSIEKQKALQKLKAIDESERRVRKKMQKLKGKNSSQSNKNW